MKPTDRRGQGDAEGLPTLRPADHRAIPAPPGPKSGPGSVRPGIADADKRARTGSVDEPVRNTPPAGDWNDVS